MRKVIAAMNTTLDGFCDHTAGVADEELHDHYTNLLNESDVVLYGRKTYELMEYWRTLIENPSGEKSMDDFAHAMDNIQKIVFSHTLRYSGWDSAEISTQTLQQTVIKLRQHPGKDILVGSRSLIVQLANHDLIDEYQLCIHPVLIGTGLPLFDKINERTLLRLSGTKVFASGIILLNYCRK